MDAIDFGPSVKNKMATIELLEYMYCFKSYMPVNAIYLKPFSQSTLNLTIVFLLFRGQMLLILGHLLNKMAAIEILTYML